MIVDLLILFVAVFVMLAVLRTVNERLHGYESRFTELEGRLEARDKVLYKQGKQLTRDLQVSRKTVERLMQDTYEVQTRVNTVIEAPHVQRALKRGGRDG